ncbi:AAA family ATPase [Hugenholtzia roseola]|uniref:AAA family ATPase n=1 Tax=Hugenholtzia roseola TaxID=1002 RepID=UPI00047C89EB|nr:AAA family ATPase [Hugenholtzia roseola]
MIAVRKNFEQPPLLLQSAEVEGHIQKILRGEMRHPEVRPDILLHPEVIGKLLELYRHKCAYCETPIGVENLPAFVTHYRPLTLYPWLIYEWSNLLPVCQDCYLYKENTFPILHSQKRVKAAPLNRQKWRADSEEFLAENPLILHPEIDVPERSLALDAEGKWQAIRRNFKAATTIYTYKLNAGRAATDRQKLLKKWRNKWREEVSHYLHLYFEKEKQNQDESFWQQSLAGEATFENHFQPFFQQLQNLLLPSKAYSLALRNLVYNFSYLFYHPENSPAEDAVLSHFYQTFIQKKLPPFRIDFPDDQIQEETSPLMVESIFLKNIRCFDRLSIDFPHINSPRKITLITGTSGTGKSTLLQLIALGLTGVPIPAVQQWSNLVKFGKEQGNMILRIQGNGEEIQLRFRVESNNHLNTNSHYQNFERLNNELPVFGYGSGKRSDSKVYASQNQRFAPIASLFGENNYLKTPQEPLCYSQTNLHWQDLKNLLNRVLEQDPLQEEQSIVLSHLDDKHFVFKNGTTLVSLESLSESFQTVFAWIYDMAIRFLLHYKNLTNTDTFQGVILLDEIDAHLNLSWQRSLLPRLQHIFPQVQFFVSTQNPFTIQSLEYNNIICLETDGEKVVASPFLQEGQPWGWTISDITTRLLGSVTEISPYMDASLAELAKLVAQNEKEAAKSLYFKIKKALPLHSPYHDYINLIWKEVH